MPHQNKVTGLITASFLHSGPCRGQTVHIIELAMKQWSWQFITIVNVPLIPWLELCYWEPFDKLYLRHFCPSFCTERPALPALQETLWCRAGDTWLTRQRGAGLPSFSVQFVTRSSGSRRATIIVKSGLESLRLNTAQALGCWPRQSFRFHHFAPFSGLTPHLTFVFWPHPGLDLLRY